MDVQLPPPAGDGGAARFHHQYSYERYLTIHDRRMRMRENEGILLEDFISITRSGQPPYEAVTISGRLRCRFDVNIRVAVTLSVSYRRGRPYLRGEDYNYHAWLSTTGQQIIRYDMAHNWLGLHRHTHDLATGSESTSVVALGELPTLDEFVRIADRMAREAWH